MTTSYKYVPPHMVDVVKGYVEFGKFPGSFIVDIMSNDFVKAAGRADDVNKGCLLEYAKFLYCDAPRECWGSYEAVEEWMIKKKLKQKNEYESD